MKTLVFFQDIQVTILNESKGEDIWKGAITKAILAAALRQRGKKCKEKYKDRQAGAVNMVTI